MTGTTALILDVPSESVSELQDHFPRYDLKGRKRGQVKVTLFSPKAGLEGQQRVDSGCLPGRWVGTKRTDLRHEGPGVIRRGKVTP